MRRLQLPPAPDRRRFIKTVGLVGLSSALTPLAFAQTPPPPGGAMTTAKPDSAAASVPSAPPEISEEARSLAEIVRRRYGKHLTPDQLEAVTRELDGRVQGGKRLRDSKLANADEPDFTFHA